MTTLQGVRTFKVYYDNLLIVILVKEILFYTGESPLWTPLVESLSVNPLMTFHGLKYRHLTLSEGSFLKLRWYVVFLSMIRQYYNHKPQTTPWYREEEPLKHHETPERQIQ